MLGAMLLLVMWALPWVVLILFTVWLVKQIFGRGRAGGKSQG